MAPNFFLLDVNRLFKIQAARSRTAVMDRINRGFSGGSMEMRSIRVPWSCMAGLVGSAALASSPWSASWAWAMEVETSATRRHRGPGGQHVHAPPGGKLRVAPGGGAGPFRRRCHQRHVGRHFPSSSEPSRVARGRRLVFVFAAATGRSLWMPTSNPEDQSGWYGRPGMPGSAAEVQPSQMSSASNAADNSVPSVTASRPWPRALSKPRR